MLRILLLVYIFSYVENVFAQNKSEYYSKAKYHFEKRELDLANSYIDSVIRISPTDSAFLLKGYIESSYQNYYAAIDNYTMAMSLNKSDSAKYLLLIGSSMRKINSDSAYIYYDKSIKINPAAGGYRLRAQLLTFDKQYEKAIKDYTRQIKLTTDSVSANLDDYYLRGYAKYHIQKYKSALKDFRKTIRFLPYHTMSYKFIADIAVKKRITNRDCRDIALAIKQGFSEYETVNAKYCK